MKFVIVIVLIIAALALLIFANIRVVPQSKAFVIERLGTFFATWETGLHVKIPFVDRIAKTVSLKEQVVDFKPQAVITKDNVTMQIDTSKSPTQNFTHTVLKARFPLSKILQPQHFVTSSVNSSLIQLLPRVTQSMLKSESFLTRQQTRGESRLTG